MENAVVERIIDHLGTSRNAGYSQIAFFRLNEIHFGFRRQSSQ
jgi:hypothetical protein